MRPPLHRWDRRSRAAATATVLVGLACVGLAVRGWRVTSEVGPGTPTAWRGLSDSPELARPAADSTASVAVAAAPFRPDRQPPEERYRLPEERRRADRSPLPDGLRLVGTAVRPGGTRLAAFHLDRAPRVAGAGEEIGGLVVLRVDPGSVTLAGPDTTLVLRLGVPGEEEPDR